MVPGSLFEAGESRIRSHFITHCYRLFVKFCIGIMNQIKGKRSLNEFMNLMQNEFWINGDSNKIPAFYIERQSEQRMTLKISDGKKEQRDLRSHKTSFVMKIVNLTRSSLSHLIVKLGEIQTFSLNHFQSWVGFFDKILVYVFLSVSRCGLGLTAGAVFLFIICSSVFTLFDSLYLNVFV